MVSALNLTDKTAGSLKSANTLYNIKRKGVSLVNKFNKFVDAQQACLDHPNDPSLESKRNFAAADFAASAVEFAKEIDKTGTVQELSSSLASLYSAGRRIYLSWV